MNATTTGATVGAGLGVATPAALFFSSYPPPLFPGITWITAGVAALLMATLRGRDPRSEGSVKRVWWLGAVAVVSLVVYILALQYTTVTVPPRHSARLQIGFGTAAFGLTEIGTGWTHDRPYISPESMLANEAAFSQDGVYRIWKQWSVFLAGGMLIVLYLVGFTTWTAAFALIRTPQQQT